MMNDYREYIIAIASIFLALALGILIGISFGEDFLVSNQREIIELLEKEIVDMRTIVREKNRELERWEQIKPIISRKYSGALTGQNLVVAASSESNASVIKGLLSETGAVVNSVSAEELLSYMSHKPLEAEGDTLPWPPACVILIMERSGAFSAWDLELMALWESLETSDTRTIAVFPWDEVEMTAPQGALSSSMVDNINTFWGQLALLEMIISGTSGHYGFGKGAAGLMPYNQTSEAGSQ